jgi:hypothetical protein
MIDRGSGKHALTYAMFHCIRTPLALMVFPRICLIGFNYAQPFLISSAITFVSQPIEAQNKNDGYGLIAAAGLIYFGIAVCADFGAKYTFLPSTDFNNYLPAPNLPSRYSF